MSEKNYKLTLLEKGIVIFSLSEYYENLKKDSSEINITEEEFLLQKKYLNTIARKLELKVRYK